MGRGLILNKIRKNGRGMIAGGVFLGLMTLLVMMVTIDSSDDNMFVCLIFTLALAFLTFYLIKTGLTSLKRPEESRFVKNNPRLLEQAEELYSDIIYEDKFVALSDRVIANKKQPLQMAYLDEVYLIYRHTESYNFVRTVSEIVLETKNPKNTIRISTYAKGKGQRDEIFELLSRVCPNAAFGWTAENKQYLEIMRSRQ